MAEYLKKTQITISEPKLSHDPELDEWNLSYNVAGEDVYFRSKTELVPASEAMVAAFFLQSLADQSPIVTSEPLDCVFTENLKSVAVTARKNWGFEGSQPTAKTTQKVPLSDKVGLFFTGGVDSFYTLRRNLDEVDCLINVHGFDITLEDTDRYDKSVVGLQAVSKALDIELILIETNLKSHFLFRQLSWEITHIAALAAVAHCLQKHIGTVRVASTDISPPWGSHPDLDGLWSGSSLEIVNDEYNVTRFDKVCEIIDWLPVQRYLRVCWQNLNSDLNCGYCEKCLRTQTAIIAAGGDLRDFKVFPERDLPSAIVDLGYITPVLHGHWRRIYGEIKDKKLRRAIARIMFGSPLARVLRRFGITRAGLQKLASRLKLSR